MEQVEKKLTDPEESTKDTPDESTKNTPEVNEQDLTSIPSSQPKSTSEPTGRSNNYYQDHVSGYVQKVTKTNYSAATNPNLFSCSSCKSNVSTIRMKKRISTLLEFEDDHESVKVRFGGSQVEEYFKSFGSAVPRDVDDISIALLQDCNSIILYDAQNYCIGFK
uniref:Uncharacterized protein n=1 Tax=Clytia hemisphaerica TaxID=252671 RepID=A0A7M5X3Y6_9CNID